MNLTDEIRRLAYDLYVRSGCVENREWENWFEAEKMVLSQFKQEQEQLEAVESKEPELAGVEA